ncbi:MAG: molecular chaperone [Clostridiales bacterium]|nr:molecular chaperone [Clostridiales bacterium]
MRLNQRFPKYEKETIIHFNERDKEATVYTFNPALKRRLAEFSRKYPTLCFLKRSTDDGSVTYTVEKSRLSIRLIPPYSEERRAAARELAKEHGFQVVHSLKKAS